MIYKKIINSLLCLLMIVSLGAGSIVYAEEEDISDTTVSEEEETLDEETSADEEFEGTKGSVIANTTTETVGDLSITAKVIDIDILAEETLTDDEYNIVYYQGGNATYTITLTDTPSDFFNYVEVGEPDFYDSFTISLTVTVTDVNDNVITDSRSISSTDQNTFTIYVYSKSLIVSESYNRNCHIMYFDNYMTNGDNGTSISIDDYDQPDGTLKFSINYFTDYAIYYTDGDEDEEDYEDDEDEEDYDDEDDYDDEEDETDNLTYTLSDGVLTISGEGDMANYSWNACIDDIDSVTSIIIEDGVTSIGNYAFNGAENVTSIIIPDSVTKIGVAAFAYTSISTIEIPSSVTTLDSSVFSHCENLTSIILPESITSVGDYLFYECVNLQSVTLNCDINTISYAMFNGCSSLANISVPDVVYIYNYAFEDCTSLTTITLPSSLEFIGTYVFSGCTSLTGIYVEDGNQCFISDDGILLDIEKTELIQYPAGKSSASYTISSTVTSIDAGAFSGSVNLTIIEIPSSVEEIGSGAFSYCTSLENITIPSGVTEIPYMLFEGCTNLISVILPDTIEKIDEDAFYGCTSLITINLPVNLTRIYACTFYKCSSLETITIPENVTYIESGAFYKCTNLKEVIFQGDNLTDIGSSAFAYCSSLTSITIPASVDDIGSWAFLYCSSLEKFIVEDGNTYYSSYDGVLCDASKTTIISYPGGKEDTSYTIPDTITSVEEYAFAGCSYLEELTINETLNCYWYDEDWDEYIEEESRFEECTSLKVVNINCESINYYDFRECENLTTVNIGENVEIIDYGAFASCPNLTEVNIPKTVTQIDNYAFGTAYYTGNIGMGQQAKYAVTVYGYADSAAEKYVESANAELKENLEYDDELNSFLEFEGDWLTFVDLESSATTELTEDNTTLSLSTSSYTYDGSAKKPTVIVKYGSTTLTEDTDYTVSYSNNTNAGTATVTVTGIGNYTGTASKTFTIVAASTSSATITLGYTSAAYTGSALKPGVTVKIGSNTISSSNYSVSYSNNTNKGTATVTITGKTNLSGSTTKSFTINAKSLSSATVTLSASSYTYNGSARTPTITVKANSKTLTKGTDYTVSGTTSATNAGTYTIKITGKGNYTDTVSKTFTIVAASTSSATITLGYTSTTYTGSALKPSVTVKIGSNTISSSYYTVSYSSNTNAGTGKVTIKGKTNLSGSVTKSFTINARAISKATASSISNKTYTGSAIKPTVTLKYNGKTLTKGTDYTVSYSNNKSTGKATITITGKGNFSGTKKVYFYIVPKKVTISSVKSSKTKTLTVKYKKATGASGYQIAYKKSGGSWKYKTVSSGSTLSKTITGLTKKKSYTVKVRAYKTVSGKKYYGSWSKTKTVKIK